MTRKSGCLKFFIIFTIVAIAIVVFTGGIAAIIYATSLPDLEDLTPSPIAQTSKVYSIDGELLTEFHAEENREIVTFNDMSEHIKKAIVAVEDKRFYDHEGVDYIRILGALIADIRQGELAEGGSTITQQYVKNIYFSPEKTFSRKIKEAAIAIQLERHYTKDKILEMYLNTIYFGSGTYGIEKAAQTYFGVSAKDLTLSQSALLAGLVRSPENYSPFNNMESAKNRRDLVLSLMYEQGLIEKREYLDALTKPIEINTSKSMGAEVGVEDRFAPYFIDYVKKQLYDQKFTDYDVFKGGLRIYTTLDVDLQRKAENAIKSVFPEEIGPSYSLISSDPSNGYIYALIGDKDYDNSKFNIATQGKRQPGSVFKTLVLAEALRQHISPHKEYNPNGPIVIDTGEGPPWKVDNYGSQKFEGNLSIIEGTIHSVNVVYAQLMMEIGAENVEKLCTEMEIEDIGSNPSIALGGLEIGITPLDINKIFSTFAAGGIYHEPVSILKITDASGNIIYEYQEENNGPKRIIEEPYAYYLTQILQRVILEGTGRGANIGRPAAGKTGTTSDNNDAWFAGYTPDLSTVVWMGYTESTKSMEPINGRVIVGGTYPADIWREYMVKALQDKPVSEFSPPDEEIIDVQICKDSGLMPTHWCPEESLEYRIYIKGEEPEETCDVHNKVEVPNLIGKNIEEAREILENLYFNIEEIADFNETYNENIVFAQDPEPGTVVKSEDGEKLNITISVSKGKESFEMPNLAGMTREVAEEILKAYGIEIGNVTFEFNNEFEKDKIFEQKPVANSEVTKDTTVELVISKGENPENIVPNVIELTQEEAITKLGNAGFNNIDIIEEENSAAIGTVFNQIPESGTTYQKANEIIIKVSIGILVPDTIGLEKNEAVTLLEDLGFTVEILPSKKTIGKVISQTPEPGIYKNFGTKVTIEIEEEIIEPEEEIPEEESQNGKTDSEETE